MPDLREDMTDGTRRPPEKAGVAEILDRVLDQGLSVDPSLRSGTRAIDLRGASLKVKRRRQVQRG